MLRLEEVERLSQYASGELSDDGAREMKRQLQARADLREVQARLSQLDDVAEKRALELEAVSDDPLIGRAIQSRHPRRRRIIFSIAAAGIALAIGGTVWHFYEPNDIRTIRSANGTEWLAPGARIRNEGVEGFLEAGTVVLLGRNDIHWTDCRIRTDGLAVISTEPSIALSRVTELFDRLPKSPGTERIHDMRTRITSTTWKNRAASVASAAMALLVVEGNATVQRSNQSAVDVPAGQTWTPSDTKPSHPVILAERATPGQTVDTVKSAPSGLTVPSGGFNPAELSRAVDPVRPELQRCVRGCQGERCTGQFMVRIKIVPRGAVGGLEEATVDEDYSIQNPFIGNCVIAALAKVSFPSPTDSRELVLPFLVTRNDSSGELEIQGARFPDAARLEKPAQGAQAERPAPDQVDVANSPSRGPANAPVTIVEFSDFECPFCVRAQSTLKEIEEIYPGKIRFVFKENPMPMHPHARMAAAAALAAGGQGKFWELHDWLFANTNALDRESIIKHAKELGLDVERFTADLGSAKIEEAISNDRAEAKRVGATGVPSFSINGQLLMGNLPLTRFKEAIDRELQKAGQ